MIRLALKRLLRNRYSTSVTLTAVILSTIIFLLLNNSLENYSKRITQRASGNFLIAGPKYSGVDLIMKSLYFRNTDTPNLQYRFLEFFRDSATAAPLFIKYQAQGYPVCGTDSTYFKLRSLTCYKGDFFTQLGECTLGSKVAVALGLKVGDYIISDPENILNPAGSLPLKMKITGVLNDSDSQDDNAVFCSLKTSWTIHGLGHAHSESTKGPDYSIPYVEITPETLKTFHFHGNQSEYPVTSILLKPNSSKDQALFLAQSAVSDEIGVLKPREGLTGFINMLFQLDSLFMIALSLTLTVIVILFALTFYLTVKLRKSERLLFSSLGAERNFFIRLISLEWTLTLTIGILSGIIIFMALTPLINNFLNVILKG